MFRRARCCNPRLLAAAHHAAPPPSLSLPHKGEGKRVCRHGRGSSQERFIPASRIMPSGLITKPLMFERIAKNTVSL